MKETAGESHQISDASAVSAASMDLAYRAITPPMASTSEAALRGCAAGGGFRASDCLLAGAAAIAEARVMSVSAVSAILRARITSLECESFAGFC